MQLCDLDDLYNKFGVIKLLRIGDSDKPEFSESDGFSAPTSDGDIIYEKSKFNIDDLTDMNVKAGDIEAACYADNVAATTTGNQSKSTQMFSSGTANINSSNGDSHSQVLNRVSSNLSGSEVAEPEPIPDFIGPLSMCLQEEDQIDDDEKFVANDTTIRIKVFPPQNKSPIYVIVKKDATVQDVIEKTIRKHNAIASMMQKRIQDKKEDIDKKVAESKAMSTSPSATSPIAVDSSSPPPPNAMEEPSSEVQRHDSIDGLSDLLSHDSLQPSRRSTQSDDESDHMDESMRSEDIVMEPLKTDNMAYELRMEMCDGECDMDFPALERGGILANFFEDEEQGFCLVTVPDYNPRLNTPTSADETMSIHCVFEETGFDLDMLATSTCHQLLNEAKHHLYPGRVYELTVSPEDKERLKMVSDVMNEDVRLCDIDITTYRIRLKQFFDGPKVSPCPTYNYNSDNNQYNEDLDITLLYTNFEAGRYKEWTVFEKRKERRYKRIFAINCDEVYIAPVGAWFTFCGCGNNQNFITISDIVKIKNDQDVLEDFEIEYMDEDMDEDGTIINRLVTLKFAALTPSDSVEIVLRIDHLVKNLQ